MRRTLAFLLFLACANTIRAEQITFPEALKRARQHSGQLESADIAARLAREDRKQASAAALPSVNALNQFIYTEPNGTPSGVFVANDGPHVYTEQLAVHEELLSLARRGEVRFAAAAEAVARAKVDVARRGLDITVAQDYYAVVAAERRLANNQQSLREAEQFLDISRKQESGGEAAHADVIKAQLQAEQRRRDVQDAALAVAKAKVGLSVLISPSLDLSYSVTDDVDQTQPVPSLHDLQARSAQSSPDVRAAVAAVKQAQIGFNVARYAYLPSFGLDFWYGINANEFAAESANIEDTGRSTLPHFVIPTRQNLGYAAAATLTIPVWNWGATRSKVKQAQLRRQQAENDLTITRRQTSAQVITARTEAEAAAGQIVSLKTSEELAQESLRLTLLRYQAGEATALEVADAQTTAAQARSAYDDGLVRNRLATVQLQSLMGLL